MGNVPQVEAAIRGTDLVALRVGQPGEEPDHTVADRSLSEALARWSDKYPEVVVRRAVHCGLDVALPLVAASRTAQLVVVGDSNHGHPAWPSRASVGRFLIRRAHCPVAVVAEA
jgi:nucleotide-binding universal stress UspA family protein